MSFQPAFGTDEYSRDPAAQLREMREANPVCRVEFPGFFPGYVVTRHHEVKRVLADSRLVKDHSRLPRELRGPVPDGIWIGGRQLLGLDLADHQRLRRMLNSWWSRAVSARWPEIIERHTAELLDDLAAGPAGTDLVERFTRPLPVRVLTEVLGIPSREVPELTRLLHAVTGPAEPGCPRAAATHQDLATIWLRLSKEHAGEETILGMLGAARERREVTLTELTSLLTMMLIAGAHSMSMLLPRSVLFLAGEPELVTTLVAEDQTAQEAVVEELIRLCASFPLASHRYTTEDLDLFGTTVPAGSLVLAALGAANRDPRVYAEPESACPGRRGGEAKSLSFGHGAHYCLGATLARQQARIALVRLYQRFPRLSVTGDPTWRNLVVPEPLTLPVRLTP